MKKKVLFTLMALFVCVTAQAQFTPERYFNVGMKHF